MMVRGLFLFIIDEADINAIFSAPVARVKLYLTNASQCYVLINNIIILS